MLLAFCRGTWYFNYQSQEWVLGPDMIHERHMHACGKFMIGVKTVLAVVGTAGSQTPANSVEFLYLNEQNWQEGGI